MHCKTFQPMLVLINLLYIRIDSYRYTMQSKFGILHSVKCFMFHVCEAHFVLIKMSIFQCINNINKFQQQQIVDSSILKLLQLVQTKNIDFSLNAYYIMFVQIDFSIPSAICLRLTTRLPKIFPQNRDCFSHSDFQYLLLHPKTIRISFVFCI